MVHDKLYYFVFKLIAKKFGPENLVQVFGVYVFNYFLIKLHKNGSRTGSGP